MKKVIVLCCLLFTSCSTIRSSIHYTKGTQYLDAGNYVEAVAELEQAVKIDPLMARNHSNLAAAYLKTGDVDKSWFHSRQAVLCPYPDPAGATNFREWYNALIARRGLDQPGASYQNVVEQLGQPDMINVYSDHTIVWYGTFIMRFEQGILTACKIC